MANGFIIRDKNLIIKAAVTGSRANTLIDGVVGHWDSIQFEGEEKQSCFIIEQAGAFVNTVGFSKKDTTTIYLVEGDYLLPMK